MGRQRERPPFPEVAEVVEDEVFDVPVRVAKRGHPDLVHVEGAGAQDRARNGHREEDLERGQPEAPQGRGLPVRIQPAREEARSEEERHGDRVAQGLPERPEEHGEEDEELQGEVLRGPDGEDDPLDGLEDEEADRGVEEEPRSM